MLLAAVFASRLFFVPKASVAATSSDDAIVVSDDGKLVTIQGDCTTTDIYNAMHDQGAGANATEVHFANSLTIQTLQTGSSNAPFAKVASLEKVTSAPDITVSFEGNNGANPKLQHFFYNIGTSALTSIDGLSAWDVGNVTGDYCMAFMFQGCSSLISLDALSAWDVSNVRGGYCMYYMFSRCSSLTSLDGLSAWDVGSVSGNYCMKAMFNFCSNLTSLDGLSAWNVGNVSGRYCMENMFYCCSSLASLDGLSAWDVGSVSDNYCMYNMFYGCTSLTSLDGLSAWNVGNVSGDSCMNSMFSGCINLTSLDAIASWNIDAAINSQDGVEDMFSGCNKIASITLGGANGFKLDSSMSLPTSANWWTVQGGAAYPTTSDVDDQNLYDQSTKTATNGYRWQRCSTASNNPMISVNSVEVSWPLTANLTYNGLLQTIHPVSVTADGTTLEEGRDFYISYTKDGSELSAIKNADTYTAHVVLRGAYTYSGTDALPSTPVIIDKLNLAQNQNVEAFCIPSVFAYTGSAIEPKTMVRLYLREDTNPKDPTKSISIYSYLIQSTGDTDKRGDYSITYANNIDPGTADATVQGVTPAGLSSSNLEGTSTAHFTIACLVQFDSNGGTPVSSQGVEIGQHVAQPQNPTKQDYYFSGWYKDAALATPWNFETDTASSNMMLYAKWSQETIYSVTFNTAGGSQISNQYVLPNSYATQPSIPIRQGYYLSGWYKEETLITRWNFTQDKVTQDTVLYAGWTTTPTYSVTFNTGGGSAVETQYIQEGGKAQIPSQPTRKDYEFVNWYKDKNLTTFFDFNSTISQNTVVYAKWKGQSYTVTFNSNGGSKVASQEVEEGSTAIKPDDPTREGYNFLYWCTDASLTDKFDFSTPITADITLYAKWEVEPGLTPPDPGPEPTPGDTITLIFRTDEGSWNGTVETALTGAPDAAIIAPVDPIVDTTRTCIGWFDEEGKQVVSGVTTFTEVTGTVTARFVDTPGWHQNNTGWWYVYDLSNNYYTNCWALINSAWFYFNDAGYCLEYTWGYINGEWYFFGWGGYMQTGWQWLGGSWYFLDRSSGAMQTGWVHDGVWYYCDADLGGAMYDNCWAYIDGNWYGFNEGGSMTQGWSYSYAYDGWFYLQPDTGHMLYGWQYIGGHWYYFYDNGLMAANTYVGNYWLGSDGAMW